MGTSQFCLSLFLESLDLKFLAAAFSENKIKLLSVNCAQNGMHSFKSMGQMAVLIILASSDFPPLR